MAQPQHEQMEDAGLWPDEAALYDQPVGLEELRQLASSVGTTAMEDKIVAHLVNKSDQIRQDLKARNEEVYKKQVQDILEADPELQAAIFDRRPAPNANKECTDLFDYLWPAYKKKLAEEFIGGDLSTACMKDLTDPDSALSQRADAWVHHVADLGLDLQQRRLERAAEVQVVVVPDDVDKDLLQKLEAQGGLYHGPPV